MNNQDTFEKIEAYLNGELSGEELSQFQASLKSDAELAGQVELFKNLDVALADEGAIALQKETLELGDLFFNEKKEESTPIRRLPFYRRPLAIAASIALIVSVAAVIWLNNGSGAMSNDELFAAYYEPHSFANGVRGGEDTANNYDKAMDAIKLGDNDTAIRLLQSHLTEQATDVKAAFALATAYMQADPPQYGMAVQYFQFVIDDGKSLMVDQSKWYQALVYIKQGNKAAARLLLEKLQSSEDTSLVRKAGELLEQL